MRKTHQSIQKEARKEKERNGNGGTSGNHKITTIWELAINTDISG